MPVRLSPRPGKPYGPDLKFEPVTTSVKCQVLVEAGAAYTITGCTGFTFLFKIWYNRLNHVPSVATMGQ